MAGEGRGHATRVRCMVEHLRHEHDLTLFAPHQAFDLLAPRYANEPRVEVVRIPGMRFHYSDNRLNLPKTVLRAFQYLGELPAIIRQISERMQSDRPDLAITDFEPAMPKAARRCGIPYLSIDHQQFLIACNLSVLPFKLRMQANLMKPIIHAHCTGQRETVISSFFRLPLLPRWKRAVLVGPLLRPEVAQATPETGNYILSYIRENTPAAVLEALRVSGRPVRIYGLGAKPPDGPFTFRPFDEVAFVEDLAGCAGVIGAAGNQTLGEALSLRKPVLALPEQKHFEQMINSFCLRQLGAGDFVPVERVGIEDIRNFLSNLEKYRAHLAQDAPVDGGPEAADVVRRNLRK